MVARNESYDNVVTFKEIDIELFDTDVTDGDRVDVSFNGELVEENLTLTAEGTSIALPELVAGPNKLELKARNVGTVDESNTVGVRFSESFNLYGDLERTEYLLPQGDNSTLDVELGLPAIRIDGERAPFAAQHIRDALGEPTVLTLPRDGKNEQRRQRNRNDYLRNGGQVPEGYEIDEVPPAATLESGDTANTSKRAIPRKDNGSGGGQFGRQVDNYGAPGTKLPDNSSIDFFATPPNYETGVSGIVPDNGTSGDDSSLVGDNSADDLIYGFEGNDVISGKGGDDTLIGGAGTDKLRGKGDNDSLLGEAGKDTLTGGAGADLLNGGSGNDILKGGRGKDTLSGGLGNDKLSGNGGEDLFNLTTGEGTDRIEDFNRLQDLIGLGNDLVFEDLTISNITDSAGELLLSSASVLPQPLIRSLIPSSSAIKAGDEFIGIVEGVPADQIDANSFAVEA